MTPCLPWEIKKNLKTNINLVGDQPKHRPWREFVNWHIPLLLLGNKSNVVGQKEVFGQTSP
jgi:hypothetical protein